MSRGLLESVSCHVHLRCENEEYIRFSSGSWPFAAQARLETTIFGFGIGETRFFWARQMDMDGHMRPYGLMEPKKKQIKKEKRKKAKKKKKEERKKKKKGEQKSKKQKQGESKDQKQKAKKRRRSK